MNYRESLEYIQGIGMFGIKLGLDNIKALLEEMGNPQEKLKIVHVAGTNGKGSTSSFISNILIESGYKTGLYTSPVIEKFNERIKIDGEDIGDEKLAQITTYVKSAIENIVSRGFDHPSEFEIVTAIGFEYFYRSNTDIVILEVGMGGRLDATNCIKSPMISVITPIALDHCAYLGDTIDKVAYEKAGIIKENSTCIVYDQGDLALDVIKKIAKEKNTKVLIADIHSIDIISYDLKGVRYSYNGEEFHTQMLGKYQSSNSALAINVANTLVEDFGYDINLESIKLGIYKTRWNGRMEKIANIPTIIVDGAHNLHGIDGLAKSLEELYPDDEIWAITGMLSDKSYDEMIDRIIPMMTKVFVTKPNNPRALESDDLKKYIDKNYMGKVVFNSNDIKYTMQTAISMAERKEKRPVIICFGSLYMIGDIRGLVREMKREII